MPQFIHQPHDKLFKSSMSQIQVARDFLKTHLPPVLLQKMDLDTLSVEKNSFIDEAFKASEADVVYSLQINDTSAYIYILCEHQTKPDPMIAFRLLRYMIRVMDKHLQENPDSALPFIYPIVIYSGEEPWNAPLDIFSLFGEAEALAREWWLKPCPLVDIHRMSDEDLQKSEWFGIVELALRYRRGRDFAAFLKTLFSWLHSIEIQDEQGVLLLSQNVITYIVDGLDEQDVELLIRQANQYLSDKLRGK